MSIIAKPDSFPIVMVLCKYHLTSFKVLFAHLLSAEVTGFIEQQRLNLVINLLHLRLTVFILHFYNFLTLAVLIYFGGTQTPPRSAPGSLVVTKLRYTCIQGMEVYNLGQPAVVTWSYLKLLHELKIYGG